MVGGGSGGHVTPVVAVVEEIWKIKPRVRVEFWTDRKFFTNVVKMTTPMGPSIKARKIVAGKFRRYAHFKFKDYLQHFDIVSELFFLFLRNRRQVSDSCNQAVLHSSQIAVHKK